MRLTIAMTVATLTSAVVLAVTPSSGGQIVPRAVRRLHDASENQGDRDRKQKALALARAINAAEGQAFQRTGIFQSVAALPNVPPTPDGFNRRLYADANGYVFSLKDTRDLCRFGIFSDQSGTVYSSSPVAPQIASNQR